MSGTIQTEIQKLSPSALVELYEFDLTPDDNPGVNVYYFHNGTNKLTQPLVWKGNSYQPWPIAVTGFKASTDGRMPVLKVTISNAGGMLTAIATNFENMYGSKLTRRRTFARFLDAINFPGNVNPDADPTQEFPPDIFYFSRPSSVNKFTAELEFATEFDIEGVMLPRRSAYASTCYWQYRSADCGYTGMPCYTEKGEAITPTPIAISPPAPLWNIATTYGPGEIVAYPDQLRMFVCKQTHSGKSPVDKTNSAYWVEDRCGKCISDCKKRFGNNPLPYGGFPGLLRVPTLS